MSDHDARAILDKAIAAHGGAEFWHGLSGIEAQLSAAGFVDDKPMPFPNLVALDFDDIAPQRASAWTGLLPGRRNGLHCNAAGIAGAGGHFIPKEES